MVDFTSCTVYCSRHCSACFVLLLCYMSSESRRPAVFAEYNMCLSPDIQWCLCLQRIASDTDGKRKQIIGLDSEEESQNSLLHIVIFNLLFLWTARVLMCFSWRVQSPPVYLFLIKSVFALTPCQKRGAERHSLTQLISDRSGVPPPKVL